MYVTSFQCYPRLTQAQFYNHSYADQMRNYIAYGHAESASKLPLFEVSDKFSAGREFLVYFSVLFLMTMMFMLLFLVCSDWMIANCLSDFIWLICPLQPYWIFENYLLHKTSNFLYLIWSLYPYKMPWTFKILEHRIKFNSVHLIYIF